MARKIPMSPKEAYAAGLLDPEIARSLGLDAAPPGKGRAVSPRSRVPGAAKAAGQAQARQRPRSRPSGDAIAEVLAKSSWRVETDLDGRILGAAFHMGLRPVPKERAQIVRREGELGASGYTPARTKVFSAMVTEIVKRAFAGRAPLDEPVELEMVFAMEVPKSWPKWRRAAALEGSVAPTGRPDMDNLEKALLDAFNGMLFADDALVVARHARKIYARQAHIRVVARVSGQACIGAKRAHVETCAPPRPVAGLGLLPHAPEDDSGRSPIGAIFPEAR